MQTPSRTAVPLALLFGCGSERPVGLQESTEPRGSDTVPFDTTLGDTGCTTETWYLDKDGDGWGLPFASLESCETHLEGYAKQSGDCDDFEAAVYPDAPEVCDELDNDCDASIDEEPVDGTIYYADVDHDGYGSDLESTIVCGEAPEDHVTGGGDCYDFDPQVNPDAPEVCDGLDNDCDSLTDDADDSLVADLQYADVDGDGFGAGAPLSTCVASGTSPNDLDCDDTDADVRPGALELCDAVDNDCNGATEPIVPTHYATIGEAMDALPGGLICVEAGTYVENLYVWKGFEIRGKDGPEVTILEGDASVGGPVVILDGGVDITLAGLTITGGDGTVGPYPYYAGGIYTDGVTAYFEDLIVEGNTGLKGAGVSLGTGSTVMDGVDIRNNTCPDGASGCGLYAWYAASVDITNSRIIDNTHESAGRDGGFGVGIYFRGDALELENVIVANNTTTGTDADMNGGGLYMATGELTLTNSIFYRNTATTGGGLVFGTGTSADVRNTIVAENASTSDGGGVYLAEWSSVAFDFQYSNVYGNSPNDVYAEIDPTVGIGAISADPAFQDVSGTTAELWDLTLAPSSACVDAGDPAILDPDTSRSDMGAYGGPLGASW